jgi:uncharacterized metal-binding protein YceD (DUF177 family)
MKPLIIFSFLLITGCKEQPKEKAPLSYYEKVMLEDSLAKIPKMSHADSLCAERYHVYNGQTYRKTIEELHYIYKIEDYKDSVVRVKYQVAPEFIKCQRCNKEVNITDTIEDGRETIQEFFDGGYKWTENSRKYVVHD